MALSNHTADQDRRFSSAFAILEQAIVDRAFPSASIAVVYRNQLIARRAFGRHTFDDASTPASVDTIYDLASVSKVVVTTTMAAILHERGLLDLDVKVPDRADLNIRSLLTHTSGLPAHIKFYETTRDRDELIRLAHGTPLVAAPGEKTEYSDVGFIILGEVLEQIAGEPLDQFAQREIFSPLQLQHTCFNPPRSVWPTIPPTRDDHHFRHRVIQGEVNDENAAAMNGIAPHAGVFSTATEVAQFAECWLSGGAPILKPQTVHTFTRKQPGTDRALGWDRPTPPSTSGQYFSPSSFGHIGYTGTCLWCDPEKKLAVVTLTNRTWPNADNRAIRQVWPRFHDAIVESL